MARSDLPKYRMIANDIARRIGDGEFRAGDRLPAQATLASDYGVTLMTLRQAVDQLERDGSVRAVRGTGTFVSERPSVSFGLDRLSSFAQEMALQGVDVTTDVIEVDDPSLEADAVDARARVEDWIEIDLVTVVRRRAADGRPVVVQRSTMPASIWERINGVDLGVASLYGTLADRGVRVERATESIRAVLTTTGDAELLDVPVGSAALESIRVSFDDERPFLVDRATMVGSATEIRAERTADDLRLGYTTPS